MVDKPLLAIVVPCYNEEEVLPETARRLTALLEQLLEEGAVAIGSHIVFVDDGSRDRTWALIEEESERNPFVAGIKLARNVGHQRALLAGLETVRAYADCAVSIDADLQDDVEAIREFVQNTAKDMTSCMACGGAERQTRGSSVRPPKPFIGS